MIITKRTPSNSLCWILLAVILYHCPLIRGQAIQDTIPAAEPFPVTRLFCDSAGESHFSGKKISFQLVNFAPPAPPISVSEIINTNQEAFMISSPVGWYGSWHPAPHRQMMFVLTGILEVEVSDGEIMTFLPGNVIIVEDTLGKGHISKVVGRERCYMMVIPLLDK
jgi:hypothetical protein